MPWTDKDEERFLRDRREFFEEQEREDRRRRERAECGSGPRCPECSSHRYTEATRAELCEDCGYAQVY